MDFNETLHRDSLRDPQYVCSFLGCQVKGQCHFGKKTKQKLEYYTEISTAFMDINKTLHIDSLSWGASTFVQQI